MHYKKLLTDSIPQVTGVSCLVESAYSDVRSLRTSLNRMYSN